MTIIYFVVYIKLHCFFYKKIFNKKKMSCGQQIIAEHDTVMLIGNDGKQFFVTIPASNEQQQENPSKNNNNKNLYCFKMKKNIFINFEALKGNQFNTFYELDMQNKKLVGPLSEIPDANILGKKAYFNNNFIC